MSPRRIVIGDIHGCSKTFDSMLYQKIKITKDDIIYLLGDYIDRGQNSKAVIDTILKLQNEHYKIYPIRGNHEEMLIDAIDSLENLYIWKKNGANYTLNSFNVRFPDKLDKEYLHFFKNLKYYYELDDFIIVHGGLNFDSKTPLSDLKSMVWQRNTYIDLKKTQGKKLVVGHTPYPFKVIEASLQTPQIYLDGGCAYANSYEDLGNLVAIELNSMELFCVYSLDLQ